MMSADQLSMSNMSNIWQILVKLPHWRLLNGRLFGVTYKMKVAGNENIQFIFSNVDSKNWLAVVKKSNIGFITVITVHIIKS